MCKKGDGVEFARFFVSSCMPCKPHATKSTHGCAPGALHRIICRGFEPRSIFRDDTGGKRFLDRLAKRLLDTVTPYFAWALIPDSGGKETCDKGIGCQQGCRQRQTHGLGSCIDHRIIETRKIDPVAIYV